MNKRLIWSLAAGLVLLMSTTTMVSAKSSASGEGSYTEVNKEFYLTESELSFIRPGLVVEVMDVVIPADLLTEVTFKLTDPAGLPLDRDGIYTPGPVSTSFILSYLPETGASYVAYTTREVTSDVSGTTITAIQATTDSGGSYTDMGAGVYMYKFGTAVPADYDMDATHTMGMYARRDLTEFELDRYVENELDHFVPSGMSDPIPRDIATTATCNGRCHDPLAIHGGSRQEVGLCILCHNATQSVDPDTGDLVDMPYMTHKIHAGANLENGYTIIGYRQSVHDYSHVEYPAPLNDCEVCHTGGTPTEDFPLVANPNPSPTCDANDLSMTELTWGDEGRTDIRLDSADGKLFASSGGSGSQTTGKWVKDGQVFFMVDTASGDVLQERPVNNSVFGCVNNPPGTMRGEAGAQHTVWMTNPSRRTCGSCHDYIDFEAGEGHIAQNTDDNCSACHKADTGVEYDRSVAGAHTVEYKSNQLAGILVEVIDVQFTEPNNRPLVTFSLSDKFAPMNPADLDRMRISISGPNEDFAFYMQETATGNLQQNGANWDYRFTGKLPSDAMGSFTLGFEGRAEATLDPGPGEVDDQMQNFTVPFAVTDDAPMSRRMVVDDAKCENCHSNLSLHGDNRNAGNEYCQTCHQPWATDAAVRPEGTGVPQSIDFRYMVHKIHRGEDLVNGYVVYGYRSSLHDYSHVEYPGDLRNCDACHVDGSNNLPLPAGVSEVTTPQDYWTPMLPETASCLSCHDNSAAAVHADSNSTDLGEACATCHGEGKTWAVEKVHAR